MVNHVIRNKSQLRYFVGDDQDALPPTALELWNESADQRLGWEFGELIGIRASCCDSAYVGSSELVLHGDYNGKVYQQEKTDQFDGTDILAVYATPFFDFGDTEVKKVMRKTNTFIRAEGPLTMNMAVAYDWEDINTAVPSSYTQESKGAPVRYKEKNINYAGTNINYGVPETNHHIKCARVKGTPHNLPSLLWGTSSPTVSKELYLNSVLLGDVNGWIY